MRRADRSTRTLRLRDVQPGARKDREAAAEVKAHGPAILQESPRQLCEPLGYPALFEWHIDKRIKRFGRLCESTGTSDEEEAARYLARRIDEIRQATIYGRNTP